MMVNGDNHISFFVPFIDIAVSYLYLPEGIDPVNDWFQLPVFNQLSEVVHVFAGFLDNAGYDLLFAET